MYYSGRNYSAVPKSLFTFTTYRENFESGMG